MGDEGSEKKIAVFGDITKDTNLYITPRLSPGMSTGNWEHLCKETKSGGACFLADLICEAWEKGTPIVEYMGDPTKASRESYTLWAPHPLDARNRDREQVWRISKFLGSCEGQSGRSVAPSQSQGPYAVVVVDDGNLEFRKTSTNWEAALNAECPWILLKTVHPLKEGNELWDLLEGDHGSSYERLIIVLPADHLRQTRVQISRALCWEHTARDILRVLSERSGSRDLKPLSDCAAAVITFETTGALIFSPKHSGNGLLGKLVFDPEHIEGTWGQKRHPGKMIGYATCITAEIAHQLAVNPNGNLLVALEEGVRRGVAYARELHKRGGGSVGMEGDSCSSCWAGKEVEESHGPVKAFLASADLPTKAKKHTWSIIDASYSAPRQTMTIARYIVKWGLKAALPEVPVGRFEDLLSLDPQEIAQFRALRNLFTEYCARESERPLCVTVFGPPGAGKSFAVKQIAKAAAPERIKDIPAFNLSQLAGPGELFRTLHRVRDEALAGKVPLVFWDEFDTSLGGQKLGWLRYFLAPMQDGQFQEGQITHSIGNAIFVFAGGTASQFDEFKMHWIDGRNETPSKAFSRLRRINGDEQLIEKGRAAKVPDFLSRLRGNVDIFGIDKSQGDRNVFVTYRRAILLRSMLKERANGLFEKVQLSNKRFGQDFGELLEYSSSSWECICERTGKLDGPVLDVLKADDGVIKAFLSVPQYKYGARSMEAIIEMSQLVGHSGFERSCLPFKEQLQIHVEADRFIEALEG